MEVPILLPNIFNYPFTYESSNLDLKVGDYVLVPFGKSNIIGVVWDQFEKKKDKKFENLNLINENNECSEFSYCPIILGVSFLDQIEKIEKIKTINFSKIAYPLLFLPFLSRSSEVIGKKIFFKFEKNEFLLNINVNISTNLLNKNCPNIANNVEVKILENNDNFTEQDWKSLYQLSEKTFVEETESLKKGAAGAGLTDND